MPAGEAVLEENTTEGITCCIFQKFFFSGKGSLLAIFSCYTWANFSQARAKSGSNTPTLDHSIFQQPEVSRSRSLMLTNNSLNTMKEAKHYT
jgi:hypothetical protein